MTPLMRRLTDRGEAHDAWKGEGRAGVGCLAIGCVWRLEPSLFIGPHHIAKRQNGGAKAERRPVYCCHNGLLELDEGVDKGPGGDKTDVRNDDITHSSYGNLASSVAIT